jgi:hypothetical protein
MKTLILLALLFLVPAVMAQQPNAASQGHAPAPAAKPAPQDSVPASPESQQEIAELQRQAGEARAAAEAAAARYDAAQQRVATAIFKAMAELKLSPKEWRVSQDKQGNIVFEKIPTAKAEDKKN